MKTGRKTIGQFVGTAVLACFAVAGQAAEYPVAGTQPDQRPLGAPTIEEVSEDPARRAEQLQGIEDPVPDAILQFVDDQGHWYTPFGKPGMTGPYDIRGHHGETP